jgi:hypothetical protein
MRPVILYRKGVDPSADKVELEAIKKAGILYAHQRTDILNDDLVIGRYSVLPFYKELEEDIRNQGAQLINSFRQHQFIADMREWCAVLEGYTPMLYTRLQDCPENGFLVVKGQTNSKKFQWDTHMLARGRSGAVEIYGKLKEDSLFDDQEIYARPYMPLKRFMTAFNGLPITNDYRYFVCDGQILTGAYYWASHFDEVKDQVLEANKPPKAFLEKVIDKIGFNAYFYALDVAESEAGTWIVVEINDGQMSGLSCNDPLTLYTELAKVLG